MASTSLKVVSINIGKPVTINYKDQEVVTGIFKSPINGEIYLSSFNLEGDAQADLVNHGGKDKAVCLYPHEHYPYWEKELGRSLAFGAFGENLTVTGMLEQDVCIGDIFQFGEAVVQISQPRQPCHKLAKKFDVVDLPVRVQNTGLTGFYFRVLKEGCISEDRTLKLMERHPQAVTVAFANQIMHHDKHNADGIRRILDVEELSESWRVTLTKRILG
ncbi:MOSC domain-containing protein [Effusibacillus consociatus]|uniref:MOSC domain-containing protein n=1 Tax=Effusibacillus consociatus TaxID=1117041 RepID=A0ABV9Q8X2_9BACL